MGYAHRQNNTNIQASETGVNLSINEVKMMARRSWRESMKRVNEGTMDRLDWMVMMAKMDGVDSATVGYLEDRYGGEEAKERYGEVLVYCDSYHEPGTKIGALPW